MAAGLNSFAVLFPSNGFLLAVEYLVSNCDLRCFVALAGIAGCLANSSHHLGTYLRRSDTQRPCHVDWQGHRVVLRLITMTFLIAFEGLVS